MRSIRAPRRARRRRRRRRSRAPPRRPAPRRRRRPSRPPRRWAPRAGSRPAPPARRSSSRETVCCGERSEGGSGGQRRARASVARGRRVDCLWRAKTHKTFAQIGASRAPRREYSRAFADAETRVWGWIRSIEADPRTIARRSPRDSPERVPPAAASVCYSTNRRKTKKNSSGSEDLRTHRPPSKEPRREPRSVFFRPTVLSAKCARAHDVSRLARLGSVAQRENPEAVLVSIVVCNSPEPQRREGVVPGHRWSGPLSRVFWQISRLFACEHKMDQL